MKLLIHSKLVDENPYRCDIDLLKRLGVGYKMVGSTLEISEQKVTLDEYAMNTLFSDLLAYLDGYELQYANIGGSDFCLRIVKKELK